jgi:hypothetical protein
VEEIEGMTRLADVPPSRRILLLSHCLRPSQECPGKFSKGGLQCLPDCQVPCVIGSLRRVAERLGYLSVVVAAGGSMALRCVKESKAAGIVAVACAKELKEGVEAVMEWVNQPDTSVQEQEMPAIVLVGLTKDGCVDTEVSEDEVIKALRLGCSSV